MAVIHCLGAGLVGAWVAKRLAAAGHEIHAYDFQPHRVMEVEGITVHHCDVVEDFPSFYENGNVDMVVNMLPGDIGHMATTNLA